MKANLASNLLLAVPELAYGSFNCLTQRPIILQNPTGGEETINVIALDCKTAEEIPSCLKRLLNELAAEYAKTSEEKTLANIKNSQNFLNNRLKEIEQGGFKHEVPQILKEIVEKNLWTYRIKEEQMLYLSGISYIEN